MRSTILIEKYLAGTLKGEKLRVFKKELKNSSELRDVVILHKEINDCIDENEIIKFKNKLNKIYYHFRRTENEDAKELMLDSTPVKKGLTPQKRIVIIAASFTLIIIIGLLFYKSVNKVYSNNELFSINHMNRILLSDLILINSGIWRMLFCFMTKVTIILLLINLLV